MSKSDWYIVNGVARWWDGEKLRRFKWTEPKGWYQFQGENYYWDGKNWLDDFDEDKSIAEGDKISISTIYILIFILGIVGGSSFIYSGWSILANKGCDSVTWGVEYNQYFNYQCFPNHSGEMGQASAGLLALISGVGFVLFSGYPLYKQIQEKKNKN